MPIKKKKKEKNATNPEQYFSSILTLHWKLLQYLAVLVEKKLIHLSLFECTEPEFEGKKKTSWWFFTV